MTGFQTLLLCLLLVPALLAHDVSLEIVTAKYFQLMTATILLALLAAVGAFAASYGEHTKHPVTGQVPSGYFREMVMVNSIPFPPQSSTLVDS